MRTALTRVTVLGYLFYAAVLLILPLLWWRFGERHWLLIGLAYAPPILYALPAVPLFIAAVALKLRKLILPSIALILFVLWGRMDFQLPRAGQPTGDNALSVLSYNVKAGLEGPDEIAKYLEEQGSDLIGLQECRQPIDRRFHDPTPTILAKLEKSYHSARGGHRGELLSLSRYPILSSKEHDLRGYSPCLEIVVDKAGQIELHFQGAVPVFKGEHGSPEGPEIRLQQLLGEDVLNGLVRKHLVGGHDEHPDFHGHLLI